MHLQDLKLGLHLTDVSDEEAEALTLLAQTVGRPHCYVVHRLVWHGLEGTLVVNARGYFNGVPIKSKGRQMAYTNLV